MPSQSTPRSFKIGLAGGAATLLAALAIAAPANAAEPTPGATGFSWGAEQVGLNFTQPAAHDISFHFTRTGG